MNETWARDFIALTETLNFSRAAEKRGVTQPAFGRRIRALEDWCSQALVDRSTHRLELTPSGELMRTAAEDVLRRIDRLRHDLDLQTRRETALTFAATQALSFTYFPNWITRHGAGLAVHLLADNMRACEQLMESGQAQFLVCHLHPDMPLMLGSSHYRSLMIGADCLVPVSAVRQGRPLFRLDGAEVPYLQFDSRSGLGRILAATRGGDLAKLDLRPTFTSHVAMALKPLMLEGRGIAWLPKSLLKEELATGECCLLGDGALDVHMSIALLRPAQRMAAIAETFWSKVKQTHSSQS